MARRLVLGIAALFAGVGLRCAALPDLQPDTCGNGVIEGGEDCDLFADPALGDNLTCGAQCRYLCDPATPDTACPRGWSCGIDGVCRFSEGEFLDSEAASALPARELFLDDVDGDGRVDLIGANADSLAVRFGDGAGGFAPAVERATNTFPSGPRSLARLEATAGQDLLNIHAEGVDVFLGEAGRTLEPAGALSFDESSFGPAGAEDLRLVPLRADGRAVDDLLAVYVDDGEAFAQAGRGPAVSLFETPRGLAEDLRPGRLEAAAVALPVAARGDATVRLVRLRCPVGEACGPATVRVDAFTRIDVGALGAVDRGARIADLDGDGLGDVVVSVEAQGGRPALVWARQRAPGDFESATRFLPADLRCTDLGEADCDPWPLAFGDLDADGDADLVYPDGIYLREARLQRIYPQLIERWQSAAIADLDADGRPDVVATSQTRPLVQIIRNQLPNLDTIVLDARLTSVDLRVGDYDGDGVLDVALRQPDPVSGRVGIAVSFGSADGRWSNPATMATFPALTAWAAGVLPSRTLPVDDGITDLVIQARSGTAGRVGFLLGSPRRQLTAPIALPRESSLFASVPSLALGVPRPSGQDDLLVFTYGGPLYRMARTEVGYTTSTAQRFGTSESCLEPETLNLGCIQAVAGRFRADDSGSVVIVNRLEGCPVGRAEPPLRVTRLAFDAAGTLTCTAWSTDGLPAGIDDAQVRLRAGDLDGAGVEQVVLLATGGGGSEGLVVWPASGGTPSFVPAPGDATLLDAAIVDADADPDREIITLTSQGLWLADADGFAPAPAVRLAADQGLLATRVVGADLDRDGLDDLVLGGEDRAWVFRAQEAWRGGPPPDPTLTSAP